MVKAITVRLDEALIERLDAWASKRERSRNWAIEHAVTRLLGEPPGRDVSRETTTVTRLPDEDPAMREAAHRLAEQAERATGETGTPHRHRYDTVVEGTASFDKGQKVAEFRCECGDTKVQRWR